MFRYISFLFQNLGRLFAPPPPINFSIPNISLRERREIVAFVIKYFPREQRVEVIKKILSWMFDIDNNLIFALALTTNHNSQVEYELLSSDMSIHIEDKILEKLAHLMEVLYRNRGETIRKTKKGNNHVLMFK